MKLDRRVDMRQIKQIRQKMGKLWSPGAGGPSNVLALSFTTCNRDTIGFIHVHLTG